MTDNSLHQICWTDLISELESRLSSWTFRAINTPTRLILLKSVLQAIPLYLFSTLATRKAILKCIRTIQQNFLW